MLVKDISFEDGLAFKGCCNLLIVTATDVEQTEILNSLAPINNQEAIFRVYKDNLTFHIGVYGAYCAILVKSGMGTGRAGGAIITTSNAIDVWEPKAVVMIGIAFGIDSKRQNIGDVLVSEQIIPYDPRRKGKKDQIYRAEHPAASPFLKNRFSEVGDWSFDLPNGKVSKMCICPILSGEVLIDNKEFRDELLAAFPKAKGGDMEASGIYAAANDKRIDWIVVKAICDFADGKKSVNKVTNQKLAIKAANSLTKQVFSSQYAFVDLGLVLSTDCSTKKKAVKSKPNILTWEQKLELKKYISDSNLNKVFAILNDLLYNSSFGNGYQDELVTIEQNFNDLKQKERLQIMSIEKIREGYNRISFSLLKLIEQIGGL